MRFLPLLPLMLTLAACHGQPTPEANENLKQSVEQSARQTEASEARLVLPAVKGNPAAVYFKLTNLTGKPITLTGVSVEGAGMAMMHETKGGEMAELKSLDIPAGQSASFAPGGKHVMVFDLGPSLVAGQKAKLTLKLADGGAVNATATIEAPGGGDAMGGMDMGQHH